MRLSWTYLEENLVAIQIFCLPACIADGCAGVGQQWYQLANFFHTKLQHGRIAWLHPNPWWQLLQSQLQAQPWLCVGKRNESNRQKYNRGEKNRSKCDEVWIFIQKYITFKHSWLVAWHTVIWFHSVLLYSKADADFYRIILYHCLIP